MALGDRTTAAYISQLVENNTKLRQQLKDFEQQLAREDNWFLILQFVQDCSNGWYGEEAKQAAIQVLANYFGEE